MQRTYRWKGLGRPRAPVLLLAGCCLAAAGCGLIGASDDQAKGDQDLPLSGVGPYAKQFLDCEGDFPDPVFLASGDPDVAYGEPWMLQESDTRFLLFFEERTRTDPQQEPAILLQRVAIVPAPADSCRAWDLSLLTPSGAPSPGPDPAPVLQGGGAPCVLPEGDGFRVWYDRADETGIDTVGIRIRTDGSVEVLGPPEPALRPTEAWENGYVGSPSVLDNPLNGMRQLWYEGSIFSSRSIGYAQWDPAAGRWVKRDAAGRNGVDHPGQVEPVLRPGQLEWEYHYPAELDTGTVGMPTVLLFRSPARTFYYMYYTGNLTGRPEPLTLSGELARLAACLKERAATDPEGCLNERDRDLLARLDDQDTSVGFAGSLDGLNWMKASTIQIWGEIAWQVNPILNEVFAIDAVNKIWVQFKGKRYQEMIAGSTNVFCPLVIVDEMAPCTLNLRTRFFMVYEQSGGLNGTQGLALATVER